MSNYVWKQVESIRRDMVDVLQDSGFKVMLTPRVLTIHRGNEKVVEVNTKCTVPKEFFDDSITVFCATNGLSNGMVTTMKNLYTLKCCLEMVQNHVEILGVEDGQWFISCCSDILDFYYKDNELMEKFMAKVYLRRPDNTKTYCFSNH